LTLVLSLILTSSALASGVRANAEEAYSYYGYVPSRIYSFNPAEDVLARRPPGNASEVQYVRDHGVLLVVGNQDDTRCRLYRLPDRGLLEDFTVDSLELKAVALPNGTFFKLVSNKLVTAVLKGGAFVGRVIADTYNTEVSTYYPSTDGPYVGKEFVFPTTLTGLLEPPYRVYSLEEGTVRLYEASGELVNEARVKPNEVTLVRPRNGTVYRLESTGYVMLSSFTFTESCFMPSIDGGFVGKVFYAGGEKRLGGRGESAFGSYTFALSTEEARAELYDLKSANKAGDLTVPPREASVVPMKAVNYVGFETGAYALFSNRPLTLLYLSNSTVEGGLSMAGFGAGQGVAIHVPEGESFVFAYQDCILTVDDVQVSLKADQFHELPAGVHVVQATGPIIVELINLAEYRGLLAFAETLPAVETLSIARNDLKLTPIGGGGLDWVYAIIAAAATAAALVVYIRIRRRAPQKPPRTVTHET